MMAMSTDTRTTLKPLAPGVIPMTDDQLQMFQGWRAESLSLMPYLAPVLFSLRAVNHPGLGTFAVDPGHRCYIDFEAVQSWGPRLCAEALLHECMHLLQAHAELAVLAGVHDHERKAWNVAGDCAINDDLRDAGCQALTSIGVLPESIGAEDYRTALEYMNHLRKSVPPTPPTPSQGQNQDQNQEDGQGGSEGAQDPFSGCGSGAGSTPVPGELDESQDMDGQATSADPVERELIQVNTAAAIREHVNAKGRGSVPAGLVEFSEMALAPTDTPWERIVYSLVRRFVGKRQGAVEVDFTRRSRRTLSARLRRADGSLGKKIVVPGWKNPIPTIHFYRDTSGSMSQESLVRVSSEVVAISRRLGVRGDELVIQDIDTKLYRSKKFQRPEDLHEVAGRGGTDMRIALESVWSLPASERPALAVVATDGWTPWPDQSGPVPVVILLVGTRADLSDQALVEPPSWAHVVKVYTEDLGQERSA